MSSLLVVIYLRVSTEEQAKRGYSLPEQREAARRKAEELAAALERSTGRPVELTLREFVDDFGGDIVERPVLDEMRSFVQAHPVRYFICLDPDRFARSLLLQLIITEEIERAGTELHFVQHNYEKSPEGQLFYQMRGAISQYEKAKIIERTTRGKRGKMKSGGRPNGAAPSGYRHDPASDQLEIYEPEARWVRQIFAWVARESMGVHLVTRRLNELGVPTKRCRGRWYRSVVREILRNTSYIGEMRCNRQDFRGLHAVRRLPRERRRPLSSRERPQGEWIRVPVPPLIDRALFDRVQEILTTTTRRGGRRETGLLSLLARCGACGGPMTYARPRGRCYLRCQRKYASGQDRRQGIPVCPTPHHRAEPIEQGVWEALVEWLTQPSLLANYLESRESGGAPPLQREGLAERHHALEQQLESKRREQALIIQKQLRGLLTEAVADQLLREVCRQVEQVESALAAVVADLARPPQEPARGAAGQPVAAGLLETEQEAVRRRLEHLPPHLRRELVLKLVRSVTIRADGTWEIDPY